MEDLFSSITRTLEDGWKGAPYWYVEPRGPELSRVYYTTDSLLPSWIPTPVPTSVPTTPAPSAEGCMNGVMDGDESDTDWYVPS